MDLDDLIHKKGGRRQRETSTVIIAKPRCDWANIAKDLNSTTFKPIRENPSKHPYKCISCEGYNVSCEIYQEKLREDKGYL